VLHIKVYKLFAFLASKWLRSPSLRFALFLRPVPIRSVTFSVFEAEPRNLSENLINFKWIFYYFSSRSSPSSGHFRAVWCVISDRLTQQRGEDSKILLPEAYRRCPRIAHSSAVPEDEDIDDNLPNLPFEVCERFASFNGI
jgi:hypothetical protein